MCFLFILRMIEVKMEGTMKAVSRQKENKMGVQAIGPLLFSMAVPMMISMMVQALYNVVDSMFVAQISEEALTAVSMAFPIQNLMIAVILGTGVGINALLSRSLGEKNMHAVNLAACNGVFVIFMSYIAFAIFGLFFSTAFFKSQTTNTAIIAYGRDYLSICCVLGLGAFMQITFERLLQSTGKTIYTMITQGTGAIINIIFDWILIFGHFGFPALGIKGAALATVLGQWVAMGLAIMFNLKVNHEINLSFKGFKPNRQSIASIYKVGVPSIIMQSISSVMTFGMNLILGMFSTTAVAVFGVYFKLQSFIFMPVFGLNNGMVPIIAYNLGAKNKDRIMKTIKLSIASAVVIMLIGFSVFQVFPSQLLKIFSASDELLVIGIPALRIISISFICAGFCIIGSSVFQALGNGLLSLIISVARQLLVILPVAFAFAKLFGLHLVWWSFPIAEIISVTLTIIFFRHVYRKEIKPLGDKAAVAHAEFKEQMESHLYS